MDAQQQLAGLRGLCPGAELVSEGGRPAVYLPGVTFTAAGQQVTRDLLLWPQADGSYATRLYLSDKVPCSPERAWYSASLCARSWWTISWKDVPATLPWKDMLMAHLGPFQ